MKLRYLLISIAFIGLALGLLIAVTQKAESPLSEGSQAASSQESTQGENLKSRILSFQKTNERLSEISKSPTTISPSELRDAEALALEQVDFKDFEMKILQLRSQGNTIDPSDLSITAEGLRAENMSLALLIAVANGSQRAIDRMRQYSSSDSIIQRNIAESAEEWTRFHGTVNDPKDGKFILGTDVYPTDEYIKRVGDKISSKNGHDREAALASVQRNLEMGGYNSTNRDKLVGTLNTLFAPNVEASSAGIEDLQMSAIRSAFLAGGPVARQLLETAGKSSNPAIEKIAKQNLADFDEFHQN